MASADVLVCPHRVDSFTLSLDAIKSFEYVASGRPVVATPTSGFQALAEYEGVHVVDSARFVGRSRHRQGPRADDRRGEVVSTTGRSGRSEFASQLSSAEGPRG